MAGTLLEKIKNKLKGYGRWAPIVFFILGFIFDAIVLHRPDELLVIIQQSIYLGLSFLLVTVELIESKREVFPPRILKRVWKYREPFLHFLMGTLLNAYTIFFFKSASAMSSFLCIFVLVGVLVINEFKRFGKYQTQVHIAILSLCLICYLSVLSPLLWGFVGYVPFFSANLLALIIIVYYGRLMSRLLNKDVPLSRSHILLPFAAVQVCFVLLYLFRVLPPVPLSASYIGVFHDVKKVASNGNVDYQLESFQSERRFWKYGDQKFLARSGDSVYCFVRVFAPARFKDELKIRWLYYDRLHGWQSTDAIPLNIVGGRKEGFRGFAKKSNYVPGLWRIQIETSDGREIGRANVNIVRDESTESRESRVQVH